MLTHSHFDIIEDRLGFTVEAKAGQRNVWGATLIASEAPYFPTAGEARAWLEQRIAELKAGEHQ